MPVGVVRDMVLVGVTVPIVIVIFEGHVPQDVDPGFILYVPTAQLVQEEAFVVEEYVPAGHIYMLAGSARFVIAYPGGADATGVEQPIVQNLPTGQGRQLDAPDVATYCPTGHCVQLVVAPPTEYVPGSHSRPVEPSPNVGQYWPGGHVCARDPPGTGQIAPMGH